MVNIKIFSGIVISVSLIIIFVCSFLILSNYVLEIDVLDNDIKQKDLEILELKEDKIKILNIYTESSSNYLEIVNNISNKYNNRLDNVIKKQQNEILNELYNVNSYSDNIFLKTVQDVSNEREYEIDVYDCTEFAKELSRRLSNLGFDSEDMHTNIDCSAWEFSDDYTYEDCLEIDGGHRIVKLEEVYIEATSGTIIIPEDYERYGVI